MNSQSSNYSLRLHTIFPQLKGVYQFLKHHQDISRASRGIQPQSSNQKLQLSIADMATTRAAFNKIREEKREKQELEHQKLALLAETPDSREENLTDELLTLDHPKKVARRAEEIAKEEERKAEEEARKVSAPT